MAQAVLGVALGFMQHGCLVDSYEYPDPIDGPITLRSGATGPEIGEIVQLREEFPGTLTFRVFVGDVDVDEALTARWRIYFTTDAGDRFSLESDCTPEADPPEPIIPADGSLEREFSFSLEPTAFAGDNCYRVELAVGPQFGATCRLAGGTDPRAFADPPPGGSVTVARWYVVVGDGAAACPTIPFTEGLQ